MKVCYINFKLENPRDQITLTGLRKNTVSVIEVSDRAPGWGKYLRLMRSCRRHAASADLVIVGYAGSLLVPLVKLCSGNRVVYNTLGSFIDSMIVSRRVGAIFSVTALWYYFIDFLAFHLAEHSYVESKSQKEMICRLFKVHPRKISVLPVGADDTHFYPDPSVPKASRFTVVFRGAFLPEAGVDVIIRAAKELETEPIVIRIIGRGMLLNDVKKLMAESVSTNIEFISEMLPFDELRRLMLESHVSLGQLANHPRVHTTIPHKAFESIAMKLPYLTGSNKGVMEILEDGNTCFAIPPGDHHALAQKILELKDSPQECARVAENAYRLYQRTFTPTILGRSFLDALQKTD